MEIKYPPTFHASLGGATICPSNYNMDCKIYIREFEICPLNLKNQTLITLIKYYISYYKVYLELFNRSALIV
jgi:hypothetical protein